MGTHRTKAPRVVTICQAADMCGVSVDTVRRRIRAGTYPGSRPDGEATNAAWLIPVADLRVAGHLDTPDEPTSHNPAETVPQPTSCGTCASLRSELEMATHARRTAEALNEQLQRLVTSQQILIDQVQHQPNAIRRSA